MIFIDFPCEHCDFGIPDGEILVMCILLQNSGNFGSINIYKAIIKYPPICAFSDELVDARTARA